LLAPQPFRLDHQHVAFPIRHRIAVERYDGGWTRLCSDADYPNFLNRLINWSAKTA
jgi:hypothetical protein